MKRISLDQAPAAVKRFVCGLPIDAEGIALELEGKIVCEILPPRRFPQRNAPC